MKKFYVLLAALLLAGLLAACGENTATPQPAGDKSAPPTPANATVTGQIKRLGSGSIKSWVTVDENSKPKTVGLTFSDSALLNLPGEASEIELYLPSDISGLPFNHITVDWNPQGHEPAGIYDKPHFDFHFYMINKETRATIKPGDPNAAKQPASEAIPAGYIAPAPDVVPNMGVHWLDHTTPELNGKPFTSTLIYGFNAGKMVFVEPMITKAFLEGKTNLNEELKQPAVYPASGQYYPTRYTVTFDNSSKEYTIALQDLTKR